MKKSVDFFAVLLAVYGSVTAVSCSSTLRSKGDGGSDDTSASSTGAAIVTSTATTAGVGLVTDTGVNSSISSSAGPVVTSSSASSGGLGASASHGTGGSLGQTSTAGGGGTGATNPVAMNCEAGASDCTCDESGCYLVDGADCVQGSACKSQNCGVTQDNASVCCSAACAANDVCAADGSGCEPAAACVDADTRCSSDGDYQRCEGGQWATTEPCSGRGCSTELGGCLSAIGDPCAESAECGEGTCQETPDGSSVCCDLSCGDCKTCSADGMSCEYPNTTRPECDCSSDSECSDGLDCTGDSCNDGVCANDVASGACLIDGACYDQNQPDPNNHCRYCDAGSKNRGWTNSSNAVSCDDGLFCNGSDTCNGIGVCQHQFPTNDRCNEDGPCALTECDEGRDSCYEPAGTQCLSRTERQCESGCGGDVQSRTVTANCTGNSPDCSGTPTNPAFVDSTTCSSDQACNPSTFTCQTTLECTDEAWCDPNSGGQCWTLDEPQHMSQPDAIDYCEDLTLAGANWHLPSIHEWFALARGCDGRTGTVEDADFQSTCEWDGEDYIDCDSCPSGDGPGNGCYWPPAMGECLLEPPWYYWTTTEGPIGPLYFSPMDTYSYYAGTTTLFAVRCTTDKP